MNNQSKQMVIDAIFKVISVAPSLYTQTYYMGFQGYQRNDVTVQEFDTWIKYAIQVLDISYEHIGLSDIISTKINIVQLASQYRMSNMQQIERIKKELFKLTQIISQY